MTSDHPHSMHNQPAMYQIIVQGRLDESWADWFNRMTMTTAQDEHGRTITSLTGPVDDQVALHGLLTRIRDLNLRLCSVQCLDVLEYTSSLPEQD